MMDESDEASVFESSFWWGTEIPRKLDPDLQASSSTSSNTICSDLPCNPKLKICRLNDSIYELHRPPGSPSMQVLFFHGLQLEDYTDAHLSTWKSRDGSQLWPQTWLVDEFPGTHVLSISYDARVVKGNLDLYLIAENLASDLLAVNIGQDPRCPVILVGHCFGGLVIKQLCVYMHEKSFRRPKLNKFLQNVKGIFYYSTPHQGISWEIAKHFAKGPFLEFVEVLSTAAQRLNNEFNVLRDGCYQNAWRIAGVVENLPTKLSWYRSVVVVQEAAAREGEKFNVVQGTDHISVSKPDGKTSRSFYALTNHLQDIVDHSKVNFHQVEGLPDYPVELEERAREIEEKLKTAPVLGIVGMGGVGKTTLVKVLFNNISKEFEFTCFVDNVKGIQKHALKNSILSQFYHNGSRVDRLDWSHLRDKKMLLVMDDIDLEEQVTFLPKLHSFGNGSWVIITTRDQNLLKVFDPYVCHEVQFLNEDASKQLFCRHAFRQEEISSSFTEKQLIRDVIEKCGGLPLTLEVMGRFLRDHENDVEFWKETIGRLGEAQAIDGGQNDRVWAALKVSYDALINEEKKMFTSAATYFFEKSLDRAFAAWSTTCGNSKTRWTNLISRCLVKEVCTRSYDSYMDDMIDNKVVWVHEHLRDLASKILAPRNKLAASDGKSVAKLVERLNVKQVAGDLETEFLKLIDDSSDKLPHDTTLLCGSLLDMKQLKYIEMVGVLLEGSPKKFPKNLSLLSWDSGVRNGLEFPVSCIEEMENLAILELEHWQTSQAFPVALGKLSNLCILSLKFMKAVDLLPEDLGQLSRLKSMELTGLGVLKLPESFGSLLSLKILRFENLELLKIPESFGNLSTLEQLSFANVQLSELPESFGMLSTLEQLSIRNGQLSKLPESFGSLLSLKILRFQDVELLKLPESFGNLSALEQSWFHNVQLSELPESFGKLSSLVVLIISSCENLTILPQSFGLLCSLEELTLESGHMSGMLESMPETFGQLRALKKLTMSQDKLESLPSNFCDLKSMQELEIKAKGLKTLPENLGALKSLQKLVLKVRNVKALPESVEHLSSLRHLSFTSDFAEKLPKSLWQLTSLQVLTLEVDRVKALSKKVGQLSSLCNLSFTSDFAEKLPESLWELASLQDLTLKVDKVKVLSKKVGQLSLLRRLIFASSAMEMLPQSLGQLDSLRWLELLGRNVETLPNSLGRLSSLERFTIGTSNLTGLSESLGSLLSLRALAIEDGKFEHLPEGLGNLSSLQALSLSNCEKLKSLPEGLGNLSSLKNLLLKN